ncbi:hypothetical protein Tco_0672714 [Tanacetum coccineum]
MMLISLHNGSVRNIDEDKDPKEDEFEEEEDPQDEEDDMEVDIEEDENEPELTYPYEEVDPLNSRRLLLSQNLRMRSSNGLLSGLMRRDINSLFGRMASLLIRLCGHETAVEQGTSAMEKLVEKLGKNERVERDLYWTRVRAHEFYQEMIRRGFMFEERPNEAINVPIEDEKSPSSKLRGSPRDA